MNKKSIAVVFTAVWMVVGSAYAQDSTDDLQIIDAHTHTEFIGDLEKNTGIPRTQEEYFKELKEAHAVGAIAHTAEDGTNYHDLKDYGVVHCGGEADETHRGR